MLRKSEGSHLIYLDLRAALECQILFHIQATTQQTRSDMRANTWNIK